MNSKEGWGSSLAPPCVLGMQREISAVHPSVAEYSQSFAIHHLLYSSLKLLSELLCSRHIIVDETGLDKKTNILSSLTKVL